MAGAAQARSQQHNWPWAAARSVTLILSRSKFPQGAAWNLTLGGWASWPHSFGRRAMRGRTPVPKSGDTRPAAQGGNWTHLLQPHPLMKGHSGRQGTLALGPSLPDSPWTQSHNPPGPRDSASCTATPYISFDSPQTPSPSSLCLRHPPGMHFSICFCLCFFLLSILLCFSVFLFSPQSLYPCLSSHLSVSLNMKCLPGSRSSILALPCKEGAVCTFLLPPGLDPCHLL